MKFDALSYLTQLESLQFGSCSGLNSNVIQPLLKITTPLKIKTLVIIHNGFAKLFDELPSIRLLIQKIGPSIENLVLSAYQTGLLFDTIIDFCEKVKFLHIDNICSMNLSQLSKMSFKFSNSLKYLVLKIRNIEDCRLVGKGYYKLSSAILRELSKSLPSLHYLDLSLKINPNDLQIFLENFKRIELKKLLIKNLSEYNVDTTLNIINDFIKEKNIESLAYHIGRLPTKEDICHKNLEKLVKEIQSFVNYDDLIVRVSEIDGDLTNITNI